MDGRIENEIKINNNINRLLKDLPDYVSSLYYNMQVSKSPRTCYEYILSIKRFLNYINVDIQQVDDNVIGRYLQSIKYTDDNKKHSESCIKFAYTVLKLLFKYLYDKKIIDNNPMQLIQRPKKKDDVERYYLEMSELTKILNSALDYNNKWKERDYAILFLLMVTGMRRTALSEININNIDFSNRNIRVVDKRDKLQIYDITDEMRDAITNWLVVRKNILIDIGKENDALFINSNGDRISDKMVYRIVQKYSYKSIGKKISPHKIRASFASLFYEKSGHDIEATRIAVGHQDISTTSIYITKNNKIRSYAANFFSENLTK